MNPPTPPATVLAQIIDPPPEAVLASYLLWIPLAVLAARDLRDRGGLRWLVVVAVLVMPPAGLILWVLAREVWTGGRR